MRKIYIFLLLILLGVFAWWIFIKKTPSISPITPKKEFNKSNSLIKAKPLEINDSLPDDFNLLIKAAEEDINYLNRIPDKRTFNFSSDIYTKQEMLDSVKDFKENLVKFGLTKDFFEYIRNNYVFYKNNSQDMLFTGYYEASIKGSLTKGGDYIYPLYKTPPDLNIIDLRKFYFFKNSKGVPSFLRGFFQNGRFVPYYTRSEIDFENKLADKGLELLWCSDFIDVFFLHIQGSGVVELEDKSLIRVNYAQSNGHPYRSVGRLLIEEGKVSKEEMSMQRIRDYLSKNPDDIQRVFSYNPSYIFFRKVEKGPVGSLGVSLNPLRSIASDQKLFPRSGIVYLETKIPEFNEQGEIVGYKKFSSFMFNQDTGGAIKGVSRADIFTGRGEYAELLSGHLKSKGNLYFLIKKKKMTKEN